MKIIWLAVCLQYPADNFLVEKTEYNKGDSTESVYSCLPVLEQGLI